MSRISLSALVLFVTACEPSGAASDQGAGDMASTADAAGASADMTPAALTVTGRVVKQDGTPREAVLCQLCSRSICLTGKTGADGRVGFAPNSAGEYHFRSFADDPITFGDVFFSVPIGSELTQPGFKIALGDNLTTPAAGSGQAVTVAAGGNFSFSGNIEIGVPANSLEFDTLDPSGTLYATTVARAKVVPQLLAGHAGTDEGIYLILPFGTLCDKAMGKDCKLTFPSGRPNGTKLELWMPDLVTGVLTLAGEGTVANGKLTTDPGKGVAVLGWVVLYPK